MSHFEQLPIHTHVSTAAESLLRAGWGVGTCAAVIRSALSAGPSKGCAWHRAPAQTAGPSLLSLPECLLLQLFVLCSSARENQT